MMNYTLNVVLVRTIYASNIGSSARALANMGGGRIILVDPQTDINSKAKQNAAGAQFQLEKRTVYSSWNEFYQNEGEGVYIALTKRTGKKRETQPLHLALHKIKSEPQNLKNLYFIFGPEDNGLSSMDMDNAHFVCNLPQYGDFNSFNLAQAVLLTLFIARSELPTEPKEFISKSKSFNFPDDSLKKWLELNGYDLSSPRTNIYTTLKHMILRSEPSENELNILQMALEQSSRKQIQNSN